MRLACAHQHFRWCHHWAARSRLKPVIAKAKMLKRMLVNVLAYLKHQTPHQRQDQSVKYTARSYGNFVTAIYFHCGGLDLLLSRT